MSIDDAITSLRQGEFILLYDSGGRENEVDMVVAAQFVTPEHISRMRQNAGGLICLAINDSFAQKLNLRYMHDILSRSSDIDTDSKQMIMGTAPYGDHPTFSISINHKKTFTGITDLDRALTIKELAKLYNSNEPKKEFTSTFKTPGHVPLLLASNGLLASRQGHTEMSVYLAEISKLIPVTAICEMMDSQTYSALTVDKARKFAKENAIPFIDGKELLEFSKVH
ncbi:3,4-dihydroxy-2-butanone-4-phosphate synthase [Candidatus Nitrosotenuis uzonensis]|uniref:3,4-dihydroxy-2-butanone 4-phosphate synthase n=1 Tax=Candidatus Nitrosotenuis uzonensis TaxID=1407055 RepID=V6AQW5_9ARCH|nr:3,4-dihydroxy-2-butanone-4-phosphate synthase [Candidatus Nitrosotenuis uzonensis]CDI05032.1 3,4-dihydroxy-2-butanone 4-phosphate synthase [Candidatus Nitrosotenuis uzonensis]